MDVEALCVESSLYYVRLPGRLAARKGALLKVNFDQGLTGFSDLMAWPELGDRSLSEELDGIRLKCPTSLGQQVLRNAWLDAQGRARNVSLWSSELKVPRSHHLIGTDDDLDFVLKGHGRHLAELITQSAIAQRAIALKIKWTHLLNPALLESIDCKWRIDFNERATRQDLAALLESPQLRGQIDFLEDPFPSGDIRDWQWLKKTYPEVRIFGDFAVEKNPALIDTCDGLVLKPASRSYEKMLPYKKELCVTHSLGHPLGQMTAAWHAAKIAFTHSSVTGGFVPGPILDRELSDKTQLEWSYPLIPSGQGFGLDTSDLLQLSWKSL